jgi:hypothetical protein
VTAGDGEVDLDGTFVAPARVGATVVTVADAAGALATATITHRGARLFVLGGQVAGAAIDEVLASDDGVTWTLVGHLPAPRDSGAALVWNDRLYYLGGIDAGGASQDNVWASTDGVAWTVVGALPNRAGSLGATVHGRALWIAGGYEAGSYDQVYRSTDGAAWTQVGQLPTARHELDLLSTGGSLFALGGHDAAGFLTDVLVSSDGATWAPRESDHRPGLRLGRVARPVRVARRRLRRRDRALDRSGDVGAGRAAAGRAARGAGHDRRRHAAAGRRRRRRGAGHRRRRRLDDDRRAARRPGPGRRGHVHAALTARDGAYFFLGLLSLARTNTRSGVPLNP